MNEQKLERCQLTDAEIVHIFENSRLQSEHFTQEAVTAAYVAALDVLRRATPPDNCANNDCSYQRGEPCPATDGCGGFTPDNKALTVEELRGMDGDKIRIHYIGHCLGFYEDEIAPYYGKFEQYIQKYHGMLRACDLPLKYYGEEWTATSCHRPPEKGEQQ